MTYILVILLKSSGDLGVSFCEHGYVTLVIYGSDYSKKRILFKTKKAVLGIITKHRLWRCEEYIPAYLRPLRMGGVNI